MESQIPQALMKGDTVAFVSTSARTHDVVPWRAERAASFFESNGYQVKIIHTPHLPRSPLSVNVSTRAEELHSAFQDPAIKAIICCIGGSTLNELIPALDAEIVRKNPKILVGMSDTTVLHHFCYANGLRTFYGPSAIPQFGEWPKPLSFTWENFMKAVTVPERMGPLPRSPKYTEEVSDRKTEPERVVAGTMSPRAMRPTKGWRWLKPGKAEGKIWGGCLPSLFQTMGTEWEVSFEDKIAFIETPKGFGGELAECYLHNLRLKGIFNEIVGLVAGRPHSYSQEENQQWEEAIIRALEGYEIPVLVGVDVGHTDPMLTIPLGALSRLDQSQDMWEVLEEGVQARQP